MIKLSLALIYLVLSCGSAHSAYVAVYRAAVVVPGPYYDDDYDYPCPPAARRTVVVRPAYPGVGWRHPGIGLGHRGVGIRPGIGVGHPGIGIRHPWRRGHHVRHHRW